MGVDTKWLAKHFEEQEARMRLEDELLKVFKVVEHEDGGATYTFDMTDEMSDICGELGLKLLLYCGALDRSPTFVFDWLGLMLTEKQTKEKQQPRKKKDETGSD